MQMSSTLTQDIHLILFFSLSVEATKEAGITPWPEIADGSFFLIRNGLQRIIFPIGVFWCLAVFSALARLDGGAAVTADVVGVNFSRNCRPARIPGIGADPPRPSRGNFPRHSTDSAACGRIPGIMADALMNHSISQPWECDTRCRRWGG